MKMITEIISVNYVHLRRFGTILRDIEKSNDGFTQKQWENFSFKLPGGESLNEVRKRNISGLESVLRKYCGKNVAIGSHGTALSKITIDDIKTEPIINYYDNSFGYKDFEKIKYIMPFVVEFVFDDLICIKIEKHFFDMTN